MFRGGSYREILETRRHSARPFPALPSCAPLTPAAFKFWISDGEGGNAERVLSWPSSRRLLHYSDLLREEYRVEF